MRWHLRLECARHLWMQQTPPWCSDSNLFQAKDLALLSVDNRFSSKQPLHVWIPEEKSAPCCWAPPSWCFPCWASPAAARRMCRASRATPRPSPCARRCRWAASWSRSPAAAAAWRARSRTARRAACTPSRACAGSGACPRTARRSRCTRSCTGGACARTRSCLNCCIHQKVGLQRDDWLRSPRLLVREPQVEHQLTEFIESLNGGCLFFFWFFHSFSVLELFTLYLTVGAKGLGCFFFFKCRSFN